MKNSPSSKSNSSSPKVSRVHRDRAVRALQEFGFAEDFNNRYILVLRQINFPFKRLTIPNITVLSTELLKLYVQDAEIDLEEFSRELKSQSR